MADALSWLCTSGDAVLLSVRIQPGAKRSEVVGEHGDTLKIRITAPPVDGKANAALIDFVAAKVGAGRTAVSLVSGATARTKRLRIAGMTVAEIRRALLPSLLRPD